MDKENVKYREQGIHVISSIFTVEHGKTKVLLIKRKNHPFLGKWALVGGALYNDETVESGLDREIKEKTGLENIKLVQSGIFSDPGRSPVMRMLAISYVGFVDFGKVSYLTDTEKTEDAALFDINEIPELAYDHNQILEKDLMTLREQIFQTNILAEFFPNGFTIPEIYSLCSTVIGKELDRRNFCKRLLNNGMVEKTDEKVTFMGKKPASLYKFVK